ncbi:MAG: PilZ domain-containing protein, partial [Treponema sp.]|jgi:c-di-GMP-binding flagellar brake protein YcgR|nr:PilZ domain-containing protein [Treponema sp.]
MATPVKRIEKDYLLKLLYDEKLPTVYIRDRIEYVLTVEFPVEDEMVFRPDRPVNNLKLKDKLEIFLCYRNQTISFITEVKSLKNDLIACTIPEMLYKDLVRSYFRVDTPPDIKILFTFCGDHYNLSFPKIIRYESTEADELLRTFDTGNFPELIKQMTDWLNQYADGYKIVIFSDRKPETTEERILSETGKTLYIPLTRGFFPTADPYPEKRIITENIFKRYLESTGVNQASLEDACTRFLRLKYRDGIHSDIWSPILFHEYVVGYIHTWIQKEERPSFGFDVVDNLYQFSKVLVFSLNEHGYFEHGLEREKTFEGRVLDISASGLLFACPLDASHHAPHHAMHRTPHPAPPSSMMQTGSELTLKIITPKRTIETAAVVVRCFTEKSVRYMGCRFTNMVPEDTRFLFEYLYRRPVDDDTDVIFTAGQI